jgi:N-acetylglucosaminyldiphosphoundecaprenol N-acetyl-beta-D-mannosaminyltransferase
MNKRIEITGVPFDSVTYEQAIEKIKSIMSGGEKAYAVTPNPEMLLTADENPEFKKILKGAALSVPDGIGVLWASHHMSSARSKSRIERFFKLLGSLSTIVFNPDKVRGELPERVTGIDLFSRIIEESQKHKWRIFLLGAKPGVAKKAVDIFVKKYPEVIFAGTYAGSPVTAEEDEIRSVINSSKADMLFVAYGSPAQELWISRNLPKLETVKMAMGVGGAFDFASENVKRAPRFMRKVGLEWLWRVIREPSRIKRIWNATYVFAGFIDRKKYEKLTPDVHD